VNDKENYDKKLEEIKAIQEDQVKKPNNIPVDVYIQEAKNLYQWCQDDKETLTDLGLNWEFVTDLPACAGALAEAESRWNKQGFAGKESAKKWQKESPIAYDLRDEIMQCFRFAFRKNDKLLRKVAYIAERKGHAHMIQGLNDLAVLGKANPMLLKKINFDMTLLDRAAETSKRMAPLLAETNTERNEGSDSKNIRDRAYTHLKEAVDEIYEHGQFAFRQDDERRRGYRSNYMHERRKRYEGKAPIKEREPSASPVPIPGKKDEKNTNEVSNQSERSWPSTRTRWFFQSEKQLFGKFYISTPNDTC
jgi:hypothetical protein